MKGTLIVSHSDMQDKPDLMGTLSMQSEHVSKQGEEVCFHSKEGALMVMICALLDQEVSYRLELVQSEAGTK